MPRGRFAVIAVLCAACTQSDPAAEAEAQAVAQAARPSYEVRLDSESSDAATFQVVEDDDGLRVQTGPAGIAYRSDDLAESGDFVLEATFIQYGASVGYREAFGVFVGGRDLDSPDQEYTYLLVRTSGDYLVKRRVGEVTETLADWTPHGAVVRVATAGDEPTNTLGVTVAGDETRFLVNGVVVQSIPTPRVRPWGIAGVRVNHRLDVRVDDWVLGPPDDSRP
jgi:hypothetical protein